MSSIVQKLSERKLINPPSWLVSNICFETIMGSRAYGVNDPNSSDYDVMGIVIPRKEILFPHLAGKIMGFGDQGERFDQYQQHHIKDKDSGKEYDIVMINIVKMFELARQGNPNIIDMLFVPQTCILHSTSIGNIIRENRHLFLSKSCFARYKGYAYSQLHHLDNKNPIGKRKERVEKDGFDLKFSYHIFRLLNFCEQILAKHDLDLQENREQLKSIRRGELNEQQIRDYFTKKECQLEELYVRSTLRERCDENKLKNLLLDCLEQHYGSLEKVIVQEDKSIASLRAIDEILENWKGKQVNEKLFNYGN
jgi:predicted nucleotidyltransferase